MKYEKILDLMEELYNVNNFLEVCRGYAQSDTPDMSALAEALYVLKNKYDEIYKKMRCSDEHASKKAR